MDGLEKRLENAETAIVGLLAMIEDSLPPAMAEDANRMMGDYFDSSSSLGATFQDFHKK